METQNYILQNESFPIEKTASGFVSANNLVIRIERSSVSVGDMTDGVYSNVAILVV